MSWCKRGIGISLQCVLWVMCYIDQRQAAAAAAADAAGNIHSVVLSAICSHLHLHPTDCVLVRYPVNSCPTPTRTNQLVPMSEPSALLRVSVSVKPGFHPNAWVEAVATMIGCLPTQAVAFGWKPGFSVSVLRLLLLNKFPVGTAVLEFLR